MRELVKRVHRAVALTAAVSRNRCLYTTSMLPHTKIKGVGNPGPAPLAHVPEIFVAVVGLWGTLKRSRRERRLKGFIVRPQEKARICEARVVASADSTHTKLGLRDRGTYTNHNQGDSC